jgi:hypothetical protein
MTYNSNRRRYSSYNPIYKEIGSGLEVYAYYNYIAHRNKLGEDAVPKSLIEVQLSKMENTELQPENTNYNVLHPLQLHITCDDKQKCLEKTNTENEEKKIHVRIKVKKTITEIE